MEARLQKWGNSAGIRIPSNIMKSLNLKINDSLELKTEDKKIIITKSMKKTISLEERFKAYNGENLAKEFEWDEPQGREIW
jgi:antitoxin MazE